MLRASLNYNREFQTRQGSSLRSYLKRERTLCSSRGAWFFQFPAPTLAGSPVIPAAKCYLLHCNHKLTAVAEVYTGAMKNGPLTVRHGWNRDSQDSPFTDELLLLVDSGETGGIAFSCQPTGHSPVSCE